MYIYLFIFFLAFEFKMPSAVANKLARCHTKTIIIILGCEIAFALAAANRPILAAIPNHNHLNSIWFVAFNSMQPCFRTLYAYMDACVWKVIETNVGLNGKNMAIYCGIFFCCFLYFWHSLSSITVLSTSKIPIGTNTWSLCCNSKCLFRRSCKQFEWYRFLIFWSRNSIFTLSITRLCVCDMQYQSISDLFIFYRFLEILASSEE